MNSIKEMSIELSGTKVQLSVTTDDSNSLQYDLSLSLNPDLVSTEPYKLSPAAKSLYAAILRALLNAQKHEFAPRIVNAYTGVAQFNKETDGYKTLIAQVMKFAESHEHTFTKLKQQAQQASEEAKQTLVAELKSKLQALIDSGNKVSEDEFETEQILRGGIKFIPEHPRYNSAPPGHYAIELDKKAGIRWLTDCGNKKIPLTDQDLNETQLLNNSNLITDAYRAFFKGENPKLSQTNQSHAVQAGVNSLITMHLAQEQVVIYKAKNGELAVKFPNQTERDKFIAGLGGAQRFGTEFLQKLPLAVQNQYRGMTVPISFADQPDRIYFPSYKAQQGELATNFPNPAMKDKFISLLNIDSSEGKTFPEPGQESTLYFDKTLHKKDTNLTKALPRYPVPPLSMRPSSS